MTASHQHATDDSSPRDNTAYVNDVAVIIPTCNRVSTLGRALDSVYAQTLLADEVCVVDDGSDDASDEFIRRNFPQVNYLYQENRGVSSARNAGVGATHSNWLAFLDSDDEWLPQKLEQQMDALRQNPEYRLVHCDEYWIRRGVKVNQMDKHQKTGGDIFQRCLPLCVISPSAVMLQRSLLEELGGFDETLPACEDYDLWLRVCCHYPVLYVEQALLNKYGGHDDQLSHQHWGMDRFRVQSLHKLLCSSILDEQQAQQAKSMLIEKSEILKNGAVKRDNEETASFYQRLIEEYSA